MVLWSWLAYQKLPLYLTDLILCSATIHLPTIISMNMLHIHLWNPAVCLWWDNNLQFRPLLSVGWLVSWESQPLTGQICSWTFWKPYGFSWGPHPPPLIPHLSTSYFLEFLQMRQWENFRLPNMPMTSHRENLQLPNKPMTGQFYKQCDVWSFLCYLPFSFLC